MPPTKKRNDWMEYPVPTIFPRTYLDLAQERGADPAVILRQAGLENDVLDNRYGEFSTLQMERLLRAVIDTVGDDGIGLEVGWRLPPTAYGNFGYAMLCSESMADVVQLMQRFWHLVARGVSLVVDTHGDVCVSDFSLKFPVPDYFRRPMFEATLASIWRGFCVLLRTAPADAEFWFDFPAPPYADKVRQRLGNVKYDMPAIQFRFPLHLLESKLDMYNPTGLKFAVEQCEREEALLEMHLDQVLERVQQEMQFGPDGYPSLEELARRLNMTSRTLRRRLDKIGSKYKTILEEARRRDAIRLLDDRALEIQKVAGLLGYADPANFTRAFRQWTGQTPSQYRLARQS